MTLTPEQLITWRKLCKDLVDYCGTANPGSLVQYAGQYAKTGSSLTTVDEVVTQILYIQNNLKHYNSPAQKTFKERLRNLRNELDGKV